MPVVSWGGVLLGVSQPGRQPVRRRWDCRPRWGPEDQLHSDHPDVRDLLAAARGWDPMSRRAGTVNSPVLTLLADMSRSLGNNLVGGTGAAALAEGIATNTSLTTLRCVTGCCVHACLPVLTRMGGHRCANSLNGSEVGDARTAALANALQSCSALTSLRCVAARPRVRVEPQAGANVFNLDGPLRVQPV